MLKKILTLVVLLLLSACSQKTPEIDGSKSRFVNKFYPAKIDSRYVEGDVTKKKYPIIFLFNGYEGAWRNSTVSLHLQNMGYHVVSIGYYDKAGLSNNLSRVNIDEIKRIMDDYKRYKSVDGEAMGIIGRGKGAELALLMASYYPDIKMVVGISAPHVVFQASNATLATHSSWVHKGKEVDFVAYPKFSTTALKTIFRLMRREVNDYRDLHDLAIEDDKVVKRALIEVEKIKGDIFLASVKDDKLWDSVFMSQKIMERLKEKEFSHRYEHKTYNGEWFLIGDDYQKGWSDIYGFIGESLESEYLREKFKRFDRDSNALLSYDEYLLYDENRWDRYLEQNSVEMLYLCDSNRNQKIDFSELQVDGISDIYCVVSDDREMTINRPIVKNGCPFGQHYLKKLDFNGDGTISAEEIYQLNSQRKRDKIYIDRKRVRNQKEFAKADRDSSGNLSFIEWVGILK